MHLLLALASILGFDVWTEDIKQACLQSASVLIRRIFVKPHELGLGRGEFLQLVLPIYGLSEPGDYWSRTLTDYCLQQANFQQSESNLSLFFRRVCHELVALSGNYVDDIICAARKEHRAGLEKSLRDQFECGAAESLPADFLGMALSRRGSGIQAGMKGYIRRLDFLTPNAFVRRITLTPL